MNNKFDELARQLAQTTTRRQALKKFGVGLAGIALACFGLSNRAEAGLGNGNKGCVILGDPCGGKGFRCCKGLTCAQSPAGLVCQ